MIWKTAYSLHAIPRQRMIPYSILRYVAHFIKICLLAYLWTVWVSTLSYSFMKYTKKIEQNLCPINLLSQKRFHIAFIPMHRDGSILHMRGLIFTMWHQDSMFTYFLTHELYEYHQESDRMICWFQGLLHNCEWILEM